MQFLHWCLAGVGQVVLKRFNIVTPLFLHSFEKGNRLFLDLFLSVPTGESGLEASVSCEI